MSAEKRLDEPSDRRQLWLLEILRDAGGRPLSLDVLLAADPQGRHGARWAEDAARTYSFDRTQARRVLMDSLDDLRRGSRR